MVSFYTPIVIICSVKKNVSNIFYLSIEFKGNVHVVRTQEEERLKGHYTEFMIYRNICCKQYNKTVLHCKKLNLKILCTIYVNYYY